MKNDYDISKQFQDDLIKAYNSVAGRCWTQLEAYQEAVKQPAPRYYVSARQAAQILAPMIRGDFERVNFMQPNKQRMYRSLLERVIELSEKRAFIGKSLIYIVRFAVISPAPEFFVGPEAIRKVRSFLKHDHFDCYGRPQNLPCRERRYAKVKKYREELKAYRAQFK